MLKSPRIKFRKKLTITEQSRLQRNPKKPDLVHKVRLLYILIGKRIEVFL